MEKAKIIYDDLALVIMSGKKLSIVIGDLHIGRELKLSKQGVHVYGVSNSMSDRVIALSNKYKTKDLIILGDVKDSISRPHGAEFRLINEFFSSLSDFDIKIAKGNHDANLSLPDNVLMKKEIVFCGVGMLHGNAMPSSRIMMQRIIVIGHEHPAIRSDSNSLTPAYIIYSINPAMAAGRYKKFNSYAKLISMPSFNHLIVGNERLNISPLLKNNIFSKRSTVAAL